MSELQATLLRMVVDAYPEREGHYVHAVGRYCHAGFDNGTTPMVVVRHPVHATEALLAALEVVSEARDDTDPRAELKRLRKRLRALASTWKEERSARGIAYQLTPATCADELVHALEEPA